MSARDREGEPGGGSVQPETEQLGLLFEAPSRPVKSSPAPRSARSRRDTLPAWARAAMPLEETEGIETKQRVWRVAELVSDVRTTLEGGYAELLVRGEISNMRAAPSGHLYFTLKDGEAQLPVVMFRRASQLLRFQPEDGLEVLLRGHISVYEQRGQVQLVAESLEPVGAGSWQVAFEQLKAKLGAEGLFAMDRKRLLPPFPHCVGIVTSPAGAVIRDFLNVAARRHAALDVLLFPAAVQGDAAAGEIAAGIAYFNATRSVDVIVVARGGGSLEDLAPFNSERVARAIAASTIPVVSAVGHETDFTIADLIADLRAPTPSAAAELITAAQLGIDEQIDLLRGRLLHAARYACALGHKRLSALEAGVGLSRVHAALGRRAQRTDELRFRLERSGRSHMQHGCTQRDTLHAALLRLEPLRRMHEARARVLALEPRLAPALATRLGDARIRSAAASARLLRASPDAALAAAANRLATKRARLLRAGTAQLQQATHAHDAGHRALLALSPRAVLERGYALVFAADGSLITSTLNAPAGAAIDVQFFEGRLRARVLDTPATEGT